MNHILVSPDRGENYVFTNTVVVIPKRLNGLFTQKLVEVRIYDTISNRMRNDILLT